MFAQLLISEKRISPRMKNQQIIVKFIPLFGLSIKSQSFVKSELKLIGFFTEREIDPDHYEETKCTWSGWEFLPLHRMTDNKKILYNTFSVALNLKGLVRRWYFQEMHHLEDWSRLILCKILSCSSNKGLAAEKTWDKVLFFDILSLKLLIHHFSAKALKA